MQVGKNAVIWFRRPTNPAAVLPANSPGKLPAVFSSLPLQFLLTGDFEYSLISKSLYLQSFPRKYCAHNPPATFSRYESGFRISARDDLQSQFHPDQCLRCNRSRLHCLKSEESVPALPTTDSATSSQRRRRFL